MTKELQHLARHLELGDSVTFPGHVLPADLWGHVDIVVQASAWENCSYSLLDAIVQGRGVVASDVGGNREFLPSSCLVGRGAEPDEIARAVIDQERLAHRLPSDWPSRPDMTAAIAGVYEQVTKHRRETPNGGDHRPAVVGTEG
jgi:glycosyltransferase involved in cell wall biosynthesis